ncbi:MAG TPA: MFS transporter [Chlamydiales bacterium]|nr:MFS transporter [Chlamydiales bacterium]
MWTLIRSLTAPFFSMVLLILASGLHNTYTSLKLEIDHNSPETIGYVVSALYLGVFLGSFWVDRWISKFGLVRSYMACIAAITLIVLLQSLWVEPIFWSVLRLLIGIFTAGIFIIIESWVLVQSTPQQRGTILSLYLALYYGAQSSGQLLINLADPASVIPLWIVAFISSLSVLPLIKISSAIVPNIENPTRLKTGALFRISPFGLAGVFISGILLAAIYGLVPIYAKEIGLSISEIGNLMAILIFGGLCFQWPLGKLADIRSRHKVLLLATILTAILSLMITQNTSANILYLLIFLFGGFSFTIYPLSMAYACEKVSDDQIISATSGFVLFYGAGAIAGPLMAPIAMTYCGHNGLFYFLTALSIVLALFGLKRNGASVSQQ